MKEMKKGKKRRNRAGIETEAREADIRVEDDIPHFPKCCEKMFDYQKTGSEKLHQVPRYRRRANYCFWLCHSNRFPPFQLALFPSPLLLPHSLFPSFPPRSIRK